MKCHGDFGGISYTTGDFVTPGTSGLGNMGLSLNEILGTVVGKENVDQLKTTAQTAINTAIMNQAARNLETTQAKQSLTSTAKDVLGELYEEYKWPIRIIGGGIAIVAALGIYNTYIKPMSLKSARA